MKDSLIKSIIRKYIDIVEEDIREGHYIETDFPHYSELVRTLVQKTKELNGADAIFFTALCLPPFQWFNFSIDKKVTQAKTISEITRMEADPIWTGYITFIHELAQIRTNIYRCIFCADNNYDEDDRPYFTDLIKHEIITAQFNKFIIYRKEKPLVPFSQSEIKYILNDKLKEYRCYQACKSAYLIVDENYRINDDLLQIKTLQEFFASFQPIGQKKVWKYTRAHSFGRELPEDFFLAGTGKDIYNAHWNLALTADVSPDLKKVTLWFVANDLPACEKKTNGQYHPRYKFSDLDNFIKQVVIKEMF